MRIGVVTTSYPRFDGDPAGAFVAGFARWLASPSGGGHTVEVVAAGPGAANDGDIAVHRVPGEGLFFDEGAPERLERSLLAWPRALRFAGLLAREVQQRSHAWDAVVSHWLVPSGYAAGHCRPRLPHLAIAHSGDVHLVTRLPVVRLFLTGITLKGILGHRRAAHIVFVGEHLRARLLEAAMPRERELLGERSSVIPMGIDTAAFARARATRVDAASSRRALGVAPDRPVVAFLGRLVPIKGVDVLLAAAADLAQRHMPVSVVVAGDGPERPALERRAAELGVEARFLGELCGTARDPLFAGADAFALPSIDLPGGRTEGTPTVALEILASGVPLVASAVGGLPGLLGEEAARLVPPRDPLALASALAEALAAPVSPKSLEVAGEYDWERVGPRLLAALPRRTA